VTDDMTVRERPSEPPDLRRRVVDVLADIRCESADDLWAEALKVKCLLEMDSKEAEVVVARLEHSLGRELARPEDLEPEEISTVEAIASLVERSRTRVHHPQREDA
jgi:acyl carrier protein